ncbi:MAG: glutamyl-tRNA(Gln) amidotransferase subunit A [Pirellulaceae bacterium]|nr:MAG: glutamyl-tRNA(Gln) amidotransferase subunit A [Pirellulaceae bacterium]
MWQERSAIEWLRWLAEGRVSAVELVDAAFQAIERTDSRVRAFLHLRPEQARVEARSIDERRRRGEELGLLAGLPIAVKDVLCVRGEPTTCGSRMLAEFRPPYDATVIERLRAAGAVLVGKTNLDEFAMGSSTENSAFFPTRNPWDLSRVPGGSSGGAAACLAAGQVPLSVGTDTGGSIRQPAAFCGVVGLKPTYGRVSRYGLVAYASSLDQVGPMARTAEDVALLLSVLAGHDPRDSTSAPVAAEAYHQGLDAPLGRLRIGVIREHFESGLSPSIAGAVRQALDVLAQMGAELVEVTMPHSPYAIAAYYLVAPCEASSNLARYDGMHYGLRCDESLPAGDGNEGRQDASRLVRVYRASRSQGFGLEVKRRIMLGTFALSAGYQDRYYVKALRVRRLIRADYERAFERVDVLAGPTTPSTAFRFGEKLADPLAMYLEDLFTVGANLAGVPALSLPCGFDENGLPIGLQLQAPWFREKRLLQLAHQFQQRTDWHKRRPAL